MKMNLIRVAFNIFIFTLLAAPAYPQWVQTNWSQNSSFFNLYANQSVVFARIWDSNNAGCVFFSDDEGANWAKISSTGGDIDILSIVMWDNKILAGAWEGLYGTMLTNISWTKFTPAGMPEDTPLCSITMINDTFFAGSIGKIYKSYKDEILDNWTE